MKNMIKISLVIISIIAILLIFTALLNLCPPQGPWPMPPWCGEKTPQSQIPFIATTTDSVQKFNYIKPGEANEFFKKPVFFITWVRDKSFYEKMPNVSINWRWEWFENGKPTRETIENIKWYHRRGIHYVGYQHPATSQGDINPILDKKFAAVDLYGNPIYYQKPGLGSEWEKGQYWANLLDPDWQEFLIEQCKMMIDAGVEGIIFDEPNFNRQIIFDRGGTFDEYSMSGFREYLKSKYTKKELSEKFGIDDIDNFSFRDYIVEKNMEDTWNKEPLPTITKEFANFQILESSNVIRNVVNSLKEYGHSKYNREVLFSMNAGPEFIDHLMQTDYQDYGMGEHFYFAKGTIQKAAVTIKLSEGLWKNRYVVLVEVSHDNGDIPSESRNLFKYIFADVYSSDGRLIVDGDRFMTMKNWNYLNSDDFVRYNVDEAAKYVNFAYNHPEFYALDEPAKVGVVHSIASRKGSAGLIDVEERDVWTDSGIKGVIEMLLNLNVPFKTIVSGDNELFKDKITKSKLEKFDVVIMPAVFMLDDYEVNEIFDYVSAGGHVIVVNKFATHNKKGEKVQRDKVANLKRGENKIGKGSIFVIPENLGEQYFYDNSGYTYLPAERDSGDTTLTTFKNALYRYYQPEILTNAPFTVNIRRYVDTDNGRMIIHLVNYDFDHIKDEFSVVKNFEITVNLLGMKPKKAILYDFENNQEKELNMSIENGKATLSIPSLYAYSVIELE